LAAALRLIPTKIRTIEELGLPKVIETFTQYPRGLVLITGPTGSGKSTTQAAMIDKINTEKPLHIITIEDPIEYQHHHKQSIIVQREVHFDTRSFGAALRSALREDPDVVLIGEMRDLETIATAITVAETGHLVLATLHTNSASQSIDRIIDVFPPHQQQQIRIQLSNVLQGIVSQRLIPMVGGGRIAAAEVLVVNAAVRNIIREAKTHQIDAVIQTGAEEGMQSMDSTLVKLVHEGKVSYEEAKGFAVNIEEFERLMQR
jgi:twitching motility protein PilT